MVGVDSSSCFRELEKCLIDKEADREVVTLLHSHLVFTCRASVCNVLHAELTAIEALSVTRPLIIHEILILSQ